MFFFKADLQSAVRSGPRPDEEKLIQCAACRHHVTEPTRQIIVNGSFSHVFANPHGFVFEIGCFSGARGCRSASFSSSEFSWFAGYFWSVCACANCSTHLGWLFSSGPDRFWGLILDKLVFP